MQTKEEKAAYDRVYYANNREKRLAQQKVNHFVNREQIAAQKKAYRQAHPEKIAAQQKVYYAENCEQISARVKAYRQANPEKISARNRAYAAANPNERLAIFHKHRAKKLKVKIGDTAAILIWLNSWRTEAPVACHYCKAVSPGIKMTVDHVIPLSAGGDHDLNNLVVCCKSCNSSKHDKLPEVWLAQINL